MAETHISIRVNGESKTIAAGTTPKQLIAELDLQNRRLALEINGEIVPRSLLASHELKSGDCVEIVHAVGGG